MVRTVDKEGNWTNGYLGGESQVGWFTSPTITCTTWYPGWNECPYKLPCGKKPCELRPECPKEREDKREEKEEPTKRNLVCRVNDCEHWKQGGFAGQGSCEQERYWVTIFSDHKCGSFKEKEKK